MTNSPAKILKEFLVAEGLATEPGDSGSWPIYVGNMPDGDKVVHDVLLMMDTSGVKDGRVMGEAPLFHHGTQLQVRATDYDTGYDKAGEIAAALAAVDDEQVTIGSDVFTINSITQTTDVVPLGQEEGTKRREMFTVNFLSTIKEE